eukprot:403360641
MAYALSTKNLKVMHEECDCFAQVIDINKQYFFMYVCSENMFVVFSIDKQGARWFRLSIQSKPQVIKLSKYQYALWFKNMAQIQILNIQNMTIEQTIILPRSENWLQIERVSSFNSSKIEFCLRNIRSMCTYILDMDASPSYTFKQIDKIELVKCPSEVVHLTMVSTSNILSITNESLSFDKMKLKICDREKKVLGCLKMNVHDKILMINQKFSKKGDIPIIVRLSNHQLSVLVDIQKGTWNYDIFKKVNAINQFISQSKNCGVSLEESKGKVKIYIVRKLDDGRGNLWKITICKYVLQKLKEEIKSNYIEQKLDPAQTENVQSHYQNAFEFSSFSGQQEEELMVEYEF